MAEGLLLAKSARTLYALSPETGAVRWTFTPCDREGEWVYSEPAVGGGRVFLGDRFGDLHCLKLATGERIWRRRTSGTGRDKVNATALVKGSRVVTANNAARVVCYDTATGKRLWRQRIEGAYTHELLAAGTSVLAGARSLYALDLRTGAVRNRIHYPGKTLAGFTVAQSRVVAILQVDATPLEGYELVILARGREIARRPLARRVDLRTCPVSGLVYGAGIHFSCAIDPSTGGIVWSRKNYIGLPDRAADTLYGLTHDGLLYAAPIKS
jgi:hypothetical protein